MKRLGSILLACLVAFAGITLVWRYSAGPVDPIPDPSTAGALGSEETSRVPGVTGETPASAARPVALEEVLQLAHEGLETVRREVKDYTARLVKQERIDGRLREVEEMEIKIQRQVTVGSNSVAGKKRVYLRFTRPDSVAGREVIWGEDLHGGKLIAHEGGLMGLVRVSLDPEGMLAMRGNKYPITQIGLTRMLERLIERGAAIAATGTVRAFRDDTRRIDGRPVVMVRLVNTDRSSPLNFSVVEIAMDRERKLPLHYAAYGWPEARGIEPPLEESYTYHDLQLNVGLTDKDFDPDNPEYAFP